MFYVGDKVVYPLHGAGEIIGKDESEVLGEKKYYYKIKLLIGGMKILIPQDRVEEIGLRKVINKDNVTEVLEIFRNNELDGIKEVDWRHRYVMNLNRLKSGCIYNVAKVVKNLYLRSKQKSLSVLEKRLYENAKNIIISELSYVNGIDLEEASLLIKKNLET